MMDSWFSVRNKKDEADIYIYDEIGVMGVSAAAFIREVEALKVARFNLHLNSPGGMAFDGIAIYNGLKSHPAFITVTVEGVAASVASVIAQAGDRVVMAESATMMIHEPWVLMRANSALATHTGQWLDKLGDGIAGIYAARAGGEVTEWRTRMKAETWYQAHEAVEAGLADELTRAIQAPPAFRAFNLLTEFKQVPEWLVLPVPQAATWTTVFINNLPDSAFAHIASGGEKDAEGKTTPRTLRYLPHHGPSGALDLSHLRNALSRAPQTNLPAAAKAQAIRHLQSHARRAGVGEG